MARNGVCVVPKKLFTLRVLNIEEDKGKNTPFLKVCVVSRRARKSETTENA